MELVRRYKDRNYYIYPKSKQLHRQRYFYSGFGFLHRHVYEDNFGSIPKGLHVHHKNGDTFDNRPENLELLTNSEHGKRHWAEKKPIKKTCDSCASQFSDFNHRTSNRFCSNKCKSAWRRAKGIDNEIRRCIYCQSLFTTNKYAKVQHCSRACTNRSRAK